MQKCWAIPWLKELDHIVPAYFVHNIILDLLIRTIQKARLQNVEGSERDVGEVLLWDKLLRWLEQVWVCQTLVVVFISNFTELPNQCLLFCILPWIIMGKVVYGS